MNLPILAGAVAVSVITNVVLLVLLRLIERRLLRERIKQQQALMEKLRAQQAAREQQGQAPVRLNRATRRRLEKLRQMAQADPEAPQEATGQ